MSVKSEMNGKPNLNNADDTDKQSGSKKSSSAHQSRGQSTIFAAVAAGDTSAVKAAIKGGVSVNELDMSGWTPLRKAARSGNTEMVGLLLEQNADISTSDCQELVTASSWGRAAVLSMLIESKTQVSNVKWEASPLVVAAQNGHLSCIQILVEAQADVNYVDAAGNESLMTAWDYDRPIIVRYLVENGATLKRQEDWTRLSQSPSTALNIASGSALNIKFMLKQVEMGEMSASAMPKRSVPVSALCAWIRVVPSAALVLLDEVLMKMPLDAPTRATLKNHLIKTAYLSIDDWLPREEPQLLSLAPADVGNGTRAAVHVMQEEGVLTTDVFFALTEARAEVFDSMVIGAMLDHSWNGVVEFRYRIDFLLEVLTLASLVLVSVFEIVEPALIFISFSIIADVGEEVRQLVYHKANKECYLKSMSSPTGAYLFRYLRVIVSLVFILIYVVELTGEGDDLEFDYASFKIPLSLVAFMHWCTLLLLLPAYARIGPNMLPIIRSISSMTYWLQIAAVLFIGVSHCTGVLSIEHTSVLNILLSRFQLFVTQRGDPDIFFNRREHYAVYSKYGTSYPELADSTLSTMQEIWFILVSFLCGVVLLNILIAVLADSYDIEKERGYTTFLEHRTHIIFSYFLSMEKKRTSLLEFVYQNVFKLESIDSTKFLWWCSVINEETGKYKISEKYSRSGRLGELVSFSEDAVTTECSKMCQRLEQFEEEVQKKIQTFNSELKNVRKEMLAVLTTGDE